MTTDVASDKVSLIKRHLFDDLTVLSYLHAKRRNYLGKSMSIQANNDTETLTYLDVTPENQVDAHSCHVKKNLALVPEDYRRPIMLGMDASYGTHYYLAKGNACYGWGTVLASMVDGDVSEEVLAEVRKLIRYVLMMSDKVFEQKKGPSCIIEHHVLQENYANMLKVVAEGKMIVDPLSRIVKTLSSYRYRYVPAAPDRVIVVKDGPLLSGFFEPFGNALLSGSFPGRLEDEHAIYTTVATAGLKGIPVVGLTKHASYSILAQHYGENDVLDYSIVKQIAENDTYFYVGPFERRHASNPQFRICYYYLFLEDRFSPLRLELLPDLLPADVDANALVEDILRSLKSSDAGELNHKGEDYKLPVCLAEVDQTTREIVKQKSDELRERLEEVREKVPGSILEAR